MTAKKKITAFCSIEQSVRVAVKRDYKGKLPAQWDSLIALACESFANDPDATLDVMDFVRERLAGYFTGDNRKVARAWILQNPVLVQEGKKFRLPKGDTEIAAALAFQFGSLCSLTAPEIKIEYPPIGKGLKLVRVENVPRKGIADLIFGENHHGDMAGIVKKALTGISAETKTIDHRNISSLPIIPGRVGPKKKK